MIRCVAGATRWFRSCGRPGVLPVVGHGGGLLTGARRKQISPEWHDYVQPKDAQIAALTGQVFGRAYQEGLLRDHTAWLDSEPPTTAVLAAEQSAGRGLDFLAAVQSAHYYDGRRVADVAVLTEIARELGLGPVNTTCQSRAFSAS